MNTLLSCGSENMTETTKKAVKQGQDHVSVDNILTQALRILRQKFGDREFFLTHLVRETEPVRALRYQA